MPSPLLFVVCCTPVTSFTATTSAPTTAALDGSETSPLMFPLGDCASRVITATHTKTQTTRGKRMSALQRVTESQPLLPLIRGKIHGEHHETHLYILGRRG